MEKQQENPTVLPAGQKRAICVKFAYLIYILDFPLQHLEMEATLSSGGSNASSECAIDGGTNRCRGLDNANGTCTLSQEVKDLYR